MAEWKGGSEYLLARSRLGPCRSSRSRRYIYRVAAKVAAATAPPNSSPAVSATQRPPPDTSVLSRMAARASQWSFSAAIAGRW